MRNLCKKLRRAVLASLPAAALACGGAGQPGLGSGSSGTGASGTSTSGTGTSGTTGCQGCCAQAPVNNPLVPPIDGGIDDGGVMYGDACAVCAVNGYNASTCSAVPGDGGNWQVSCFFMSPCNGRRPAGLAEVEVRAADPLGAYLAQAAHLEAASVPAFARLARELREHGAPAALVRAAERARRDEVRHARALARLARAHGAEVPRVAHAAFRSRSLEALARENAAEGCVRETFGAALALTQSMRAASAALRGAMLAIAEDEARHAELAWRLDAWAAARLAPAARRRVASARRRAVAALQVELGREAPVPLRLAAGLPDAVHARALVDALGRSLAWS